jgi:hypothetical protein
VAADESHPSHPAVDAALSAWRQGDCVVGGQRFVHRFDASRPLTEEAQDAAESGADLAQAPVAGLVVLTQTCDVVRECRERPLSRYALSSKRTQVSFEKWREAGALPTRLCRRSPRSDWWLISIAS